MKTVTLAHGNGGAENQELISKVFYRAFKNDILTKSEDAAVIENGTLAFTTDSFTVSPIFFNGADIGKLAICGTCNDLAMMGAKPKYLTCSVIIEEGFEIKDLEDTDLLQITAKTSENLKFRSWFLIFLTDYNFKNPLKPINYYTELNNYGWIFYTKSSFFHRRHYIDPLLSFKENNIGPHSTIIARRAKDVSESGMTTESTILK